MGIPRANECRGFLLVLIDFAFPYLGMKIPLGAICGLWMGGTGFAEVTTVAHSEIAFQPDKTVVWSPLFQATWDSMNGMCGGIPVRIEPPNETMAKLDAFHFDAVSVLPEGYWKVWAGKATEEFVEKVNKEAAEITGEKDGPFKYRGGAVGSVAAFGLLDRKLEFEKAFYRSKAKSLNFGAKSGPVQVQFFGVAGDLSSYFRESIRILFHDPKKESHAVDIRGKDSKESVICYLPPSPSDFATACAAIRGWRSGYKEDQTKFGRKDDPQFHYNDTLKVPYASLSVKSSFPELTGIKRFYGTREVPWLIYQAEQLTRFEMDETGVRVRVDTSLAAEPFGEPPPIFPRNFVFDRPFFIFLWRDDAEWPYFGAWIGDASTLKAFK